MAQQQFVIENKVTGQLNGPYSNIEAAFNAVDKVKAEWKQERINPKIIVRQLYAA